LICRFRSYCVVFLFHGTPTTVFSPLSLHDALPISWRPAASFGPWSGAAAVWRFRGPPSGSGGRRSLCRRPGSSGAGGGCCDSGRRPRSEEHTSELQSRENLVCRLLLEKKNGAVTAAALTAPRWV